MRAWENHSWIARSVPIDLRCCLALSALKIASWSANVLVLCPPGVQHLKGLGRPGPMIVKCGAQMQESPTNAHSGRALLWLGSYNLKTFVAGEIKRMSSGRRGTQLPRKYPRIH